MADPDIPLVARKGAQRMYERARGTDYRALVDRNTQRSSVRPPPLTDRQLAGLERLESDYWNLRDAEFTKRYGRSRMDYWKARDALVNLRNQHLRAQEEAIRLAEETHGKIDIDRQRQAEQDLSSLNRAIEAARSSPLASAFLLYANARGGSLEQQADAAELGQATAALGGALTAAAGAANRRRELREYKGSAGLTLGPVEHQPVGVGSASKARPPWSPRAPESEAPPTPQMTERRGQQLQISDSERKVTDENRGLISASDPALGLRRRSSQPPQSQGRKPAAKPAAGAGPAAGAPAATATPPGGSKPPIPVDPDATPPYGITTGGKPIVRINAPEIDLGAGELIRATWPGDPRAVVRFKEVQDGVEIGYIAVGQQTGQGAQMLSSALQRAAKSLGKPGLARPAFLQSQNVVNKTLKELILTGRMEEAQKIVRRSSLVYARALGGTAGIPVLELAGEAIRARVPITY